MSLTPQDAAPFPVAHARTAWALHEWTRLLYEATTSVYAERYQRAAIAVASSLDAVEAMHELVRVFFAPPPQVKRWCLSCALRGRFCCFRIWC